ncbi:malate synthase [Anoxybacillus caldiproteolyticus]|uniref:Malate synthase n=1 Tax=Thermaerobacillus caldiproteolyticus TaxID=247480 RepID=A0A7W0BYD5_9BACL|nr:malate synthase [Anoxybacillus caldiproteolyticus]
MRDTVNRTIIYESPDGKKYELKDDIAVLKFRPRGWHLEEKHVTLDD